jgi:alpha-glucosidase
MRKLLLVALFSLAVSNAQAQIYKLASPDGLLNVKINIRASASIELSKGKTTLIKLDDIDLVADEKILTGMEVKKSSNQSVSNLVIPVVKEKSESFPDNYNELTIEFKSFKSLIFRLYNEGLAYRFGTWANDSLTILKETLNMQLNESDSMRYQASRSFNSSYETPYEHHRLGDMEEVKLINLPLLVEKQSGTMLMVTESDLYDYPGLWFVNRGSAELEGVQAPFPKTLNYSGSVYGHGQIKEANDFIAKVEGERSYPWRIFAIAEKEEDLIQNNMVYLLASPCALEDYSWIKPGVVMFDWWAKKYIYGVDFKSGINTATAKYFIDFCAAQGFRYFLFDDGWCPKDDLLSVNPELDMEEVTSYAAEKGVDIMLWVIWHALERQWEEAFEQFERWGIRGIKMDFMNRDDQKMVQFYESVAQKAAEHKMVVNFHGAYKPSGLRRKYPNVLTREALIEFEYNGWTDYVTPEHDNILPYIRMFTGPMDYIPGTLRNSTKESFRKAGNFPMGQGTRAHAMALFVILNSPMTMLPDSPSDYYREQECTDFLATIPVEWDETKLFKGKIGQYTLLGRRSGDEWFLGATTDWNARKFTLNTEFLGPGKYQVEIISDGINADTRAEDYKRSTIYIHRGDNVEISMVSGGGWVARFTPVN